MSILNQIFKFSEIINNQPFSIEVFDKTKKIRKEVSQYFTTANYPLLNDDELFYFCVILSVSLEDNNISNIMVAAELSLKRVDLVQIRFQKHLMTYIEKGYIEKKERHYNSRREHQEFSVNEEIYNCIILDQPLKNKGETKYDIINFTLKVKQLLKAIENNNITLATAVMQLQSYQSKIQSPVIELLNTFDMDNIDYYLFLICCYDYINDRNDHRVQVRHLISQLCDEDGATIFRIKREIQYGTYFLIKQGLVQHADEQDFREGHAICLTELVKNLIDQDDLIYSSEPKVDKNLIEIKPEDVPILFYNDDIKSQLDRIKQVIEPNNFKRIVSEFKSHNLPTHCNILLTGSAGSGKTSMVYDICASINALMYPVNVADLKSPYYGATQKIISDAFAKLKKLSQANKDRTIVLFLDEADSLINKRFEDVQSSTSQTDNAVQGLLYQFLETLNPNCLLIATSNMSASFADDATLRRFLYKLDVGLPSPITSEKIWRHNLKGYSDNLYQRLSVLGLTGGYITNICRKVIMEKMIYQTVATEEMIYQWAMAETALKTGQISSVVGFQKAS